MANGVNGTAYIRTNTAVNLTSYKYLKIKISVSNYNDLTHSAYIGVSTSASYNGIVAKSATVYNGNTSILISDVTSLSGMYYIYIVYIAQSIYAVCDIYSIILSNS